MHRVVTSLTFHLQLHSNFFIDSEIVKPVLDPTLRVLKTYAPKILSIEVDRLLQEVIIHSSSLFSRSQACLSFVDCRERDKNLFSICEYHHISITTHGLSSATYSLIFLGKSYRFHLSTTCNLRYYPTHNSSQR